ncbi:MAG: nucleoside-diphosphate sugar epimerase/dehydratase, partial [Gaiellaceae bacterium]
MATRSAATAAPLFEPAAAAAAGEEGLRLGLGLRARWALGCFALDATMLVLAAFATELGARAAEVRSLSLAWTAAFGLIALAALALRGMYRPDLRLRTVDDARRVVGAVTVAAMALLSVAAVTGTAPVVAGELVRLWAFAGVYVVAGRIGLYRAQVRARRAGEGLRPTLVVGAGTVGRMTARRLLERPELGLRPVGFLDKNPREPGEDGVALPVLGASWDLEQIVAEHGVEQVIITFSTAPNDVLLRMVRRCESLGLDVAVVPRLYEQTTTRLTVEHIGGLPLLAAHTVDPRGW